MSYLPPIARRRLEQDKKLNSGYVPPRERRKQAIAQSVSKGMESLSGVTESINTGLSGINKTINSGLKNLASMQTSPVHTAEANTQSLVPSVQKNASDNLLHLMEKREKAKDTYLRELAALKADGKENGPSASNLRDRLSELPSDKEIQRQARELDNNIIHDGTIRNDIELTTGSKIKNTLTDAGRKAKLVGQQVGLGFGKPVMALLGAKETPEQRERRIKDTLGYTPYAELNKGEKRLAGGAEAAGTIGRYGLTYALGAPVIGKYTNPVTQKILQAGLDPKLTQIGAATAPRLLRGVAAAGFGAGVEDLILDTPQGVLDAIAEGKEGKELLADTGQNILFNSVANLLFRGAGSAIDVAKAVKGSKIAKQSSETIEKAIKELPQEQAQQVIKAETDKVVKEISNNTSLANSLKSADTPVIDKPIKQTESIIPAVNKEPLNTPNIKPQVQSTTENAYKQIEAKGPVKKYSFPQGRIDVDGLKKEIGNIAEKHPLEYNAVNDKETLEVARGIVENNLDVSKNMVRKGEVYNNAIESAVGMETIDKMFKAKNYDEAFELLEKHSDKLKRMGQANQIASAWARSTPEGMVKWTDRIINEAKEKGLKLTTDDTKAFKKKIYEDMSVVRSIDNPEEMIKQIEQAYGKKLPNWVNNQLNRQTQEKLKEIATEQVLNDVRGLIKPSAWKKLSTTQAMAHLLNVPTAMRNIFGNLTFNEAERASNLYAIPIDKLMALKTGKRTLTTPTSWRKTIGPAVDRAKDSAMFTHLGINSDVGKYTIQRGSAFKGKAGKFGEKMLSYELKVPDEFFKGQIREDILQQQMKLAGVTKPTKEMIDIAEETMRYRTFQDDSLPSKLLQGIKDVANNVGFGKRIRGSSGISTKEFGLGDLVIKYPRVPGNIISRAVEYTPAGYLKGIHMLGKIGNNPKLQHEAAMAFGRATNGSLMIGMAALMHQKGLLIIGDDSEDKDLSALEKFEGLGNFKVNLSGIARVLNGESAELQKGDELSTLNWIEPIGKSWIIGAAINREVQKGKSTQEVVTASLNQSLDEVLDLPTLSIVKSMFYTGMRSDSNAIDVMITPVTEAIPGFVPSPVRQLTQAIDPIQREQFSGKPIERLGKRIQGSIPGLSKSLVPKISSTGEEIEPQGRGTRAYLNRALNPAIQKQYNPNMFTEQLKKIEQYTQRTDIYPPSTAPSSLTDKKVKYTLTEAEKAEYMRISGAIIKDKFNDIGEITEANAEREAKRLRKIIDAAREEAKKQILKQKKSIIPKVGANR